MSALRKLVTSFGKGSLDEDEPAHSAVRSAAVFFRSYFFAGREARPPHRNHAFSAGGWSLQSSGKVDEKGEVLSTPAFQPKDWYTVTVPTTVVAALVKHKVYPDPVFGTNLRSFPGVTYPIGANFSNIPMQPDSPFIVPWWYRKEFVLPASFKGKSIWLNFGGINYRANIWLNGKQIAKSEDVAGAWRTYEFNITDAAMPGKTECARGAGLLAHRHRSGHHVRGLEPRASGQEHGLVARCGDHDQRAGGAALSRRGFESGFAGQRQGAPHGDRAAEECGQPSGERNAQRADREDRIFPGG